MWSCFSTNERQAVPRRTHAVLFTTYLDHLKLPKLAKRRNIGLFAYTRRHPLHFHSLAHDDLNPYEPSL